MSASIGNTASRIRTRMPATAPQPTAAARVSDTSWAKSGDDARRAREAEIQRQKEAEERRASGIYMPFYFFLKVGEAKEIIILDATPGFSIYEHSLQDPKTGFWSIRESCPKERAHCPLCSGGPDIKIVGAGKESRYVMKLTIMDLTPYERDEKVNGRPTGKKIMVPFSRKLLNVGAADQGFFYRQFDKRQPPKTPDGESYNTLRGLHLLMTRETKDTSNIGRPEILTDASDAAGFVGWHDEQSLIDSFGSPAVQNDQGKVIRIANADCYAYDYGLLFREPNAEDLRRRYGGAAPAGSRQDRASTLADGGRHTHSQGVPAGHPANESPPDDLDDDIPF